MTRARELTDWRTIASRWRPRTFSTQPLIAGVLAVDSAENSGYSYQFCGKIHRSGEISTKVRDFEQVVHLIRDIETLHFELVQRGNFARVPFVLFLEKPPEFVYKNRTAATLIGLGSARYAWELGWHLAAQEQSAIARAEPGVWRRKVLGQSHRKPGEPKNTIAQLEQLLANHLRPERVGLSGADERTAVCIAHYSTRAPEVAELL